MKPGRAGSGLTTTEPVCPGCGERTDLACPLCGQKFHGEWSRARHVRNDHAGGLEAVLRAYDMLASRTGMP